MARLTDSDAGCVNFRKSLPPHRRHVLQIGGLYGLGLALADLLKAQALSKPHGSFGRAKSVILLYLHGGHAQQETWDPKPDGPYPARGEFGAISTSLPGVRIGELLPQSAKIMHKLAVIRSLTHANANHVQASLAAMSGHSHSPGTESKGDMPPSATDFPPFGAVLDHLRPARELPSWVQVGPLMRRNNGTVLHGQSPGFLGGKHGPLVIDQELRQGARIEAVTPRTEVPLLRLSERRDLLKQFDTQRGNWDRDLDVQSFDDYQKRALNLLTAPALARSFNLAGESANLRERYGPTQFGQSCLLARRLAEAGVPMINVHYCRTPVGSWDTHGQHFRQMKETLCPTFDRAFATLVSDLDERGLLDETVVLATAEFGRTPRVNRSAGRDHWPWVYSVALAGGGTGRGVVYGSSDKSAAYPLSHAHDPADLAATIYHLLGIPATNLHDQAHRPHALLAGQKIQGLLARC